MVQIIIFISSIIGVATAILYVYSHSIGLHNKRAIARFLLLIIGSSFLTAMVGIGLNSIQWLRDGDIFGGIFFIIISMMLSCYALAMVIGSIFLSREKINQWLEYIFKIRQH